MHDRTTLVGFALVFASIGGPGAITAQDADGVIAVTGQAVEWRDLGGGLKMASLQGNSSAEGEHFVFRLATPDGFEMQPHTHPVTENMTVLSGRFYVGLGETFDRSAALGYGPGSYISIDAGVPAYMFSVGPTVVQVHGVGPLRTIYLSGGAER